jgi:endoglucanase
MKKRSIGNWVGRVATIGLAFAAAHCSSSEDDGVEVPQFAGTSPGANSGTGVPNVPSQAGAPAGTGTPGVNGQPSGTNEGTPSVGGIQPSTSPGGGTPSGAGPAAPAGGDVPAGTDGTAALPGTPAASDPGLPAQPGAPAAVAPDLSCGGINVASADVISDFSTGEPIMYAVGTRGGTTWESYAGTPQSDPSTAGNNFQVDPNQSGPCNSGGSLHVSSPGNNSYGVGFGINFRPDIAPNVSDLYDARADGYTGVGFWTNCQEEVELTFLKFSDDATDASVQRPVCTDATCRQYGVKNSVLLADQWVHHELYFDEALLDNIAPNAGTGLHANALTAVQIQMNTKAGAQPNGFDCFVDDVHFIRTPTPRAPAPGNVTNINGHTIAPGGYYSQGNRIFDSRGNVHLFKGFARPSMEFDSAGFGITREDMQLMASKGANVVRFALSEGYWLSTHPQFSPNYQAYVDRAVQWTLQAGMDVILDLHFSGAPTAAQQTMADKQAITFWQQVAQKYKNDGRVMFELYNEPHDVSATVWRNGDGQIAGMQQLYDAVRATGANNLVLAGGLDFSYRLDLVLPAQQLTGINIAYVTHPYKFKTPALPQGYAGVTATFPVIATEFGDADISGIGPDGCDTTTYRNSIADFTARGMGWTAWAWTVEAKRCAFPTLILKYDGTPTPPGQVVFDALRN